MKMCLHFQNCPIEQQIRISQSKESQEIRLLLESKAFGFDLATDRVCVSVKLEHTSAADSALNEHKRKLYHFRLEHTSWTRKGHFRRYLRLLTNKPNQSVARLGRWQATKQKLVS